MFKLVHVYVKQSAYKNVMPTVQLGPDHIPLNE